MFGTLEKAEQRAATGPPWSEAPSRTGGAGHGW